MATRHIAVIGAGAVGLSTALCVQQAVPNAKITLISDKFDEDTTSWGAGGLFRLDLDHHPKEEHGKIRQWATDSWNRYSFLAHSDQAKKSGMFFVAGTVLYNVPKDAGYSLMSELSYDFHKLDGTQLKEMNPNVSHKYGYGFTSLLTHTETYLRWLLRQFLSQGGSVQCRKLTSLTQLEDGFDVVVNCCGLQAVELCQDKSMFPIMGHLIKVTLNIYQTCQPVRNCVSKHA
ncbi:D-aspartate oxidase-like [Plakobranchus ocellatus]|uniref:D-aspartate oxidase-like n=1 Tax=Plakobranchus ocellatus TaxID=259542 RepID=A0AAV4CAJ0_9GAST|nr:D-aspartate oxidase-like [Plakobranchus ocellatus]